MQTNRLRVSIVIPVYNEESYLPRCLDAIAAQTVAPFEVIVVDNNSTDRTAAIARSYPFVRVIKEKRQGVVYARDAGFNVARGEIIGRLDADSCIADNWVAEVRSVFADPTIEAASGLVGYRDVALGYIFDAVDKYIRHYLARRMSSLNELFLYGVNMAIRRSSWGMVRGEVCHQRRLHEDLDLAAHMAHRGQRLVFAPTMWATIAPRQAASSPREFFRYVWSNSAVFKAHNLVSLRYVNRVALFVSCLYVPIHFLYRGYDPDLQRFSVSYIWRNTMQARVSPVSETL